MIMLSLINTAQWHTRSLSQTSLHEHVDINIHQSSPMKATETWARS
jgi:hypothetical protein